ncbi:hypothetical protein GQ42DRAFT_153361 [Ramicandelaber brevisporus]|nr:hypothetical protein GQ42DRAFT_153361 [Ramicandelaber brevisporus]
MFVGWAAVVSAESGALARAESIAEAYFKSTTAALLKALTSRAVRLEPAADASILCQAVVKDAQSLLGSGCIGLVAASSACVPADVVDAAVYPLKALTIASSDKTTVALTLNLQSPTIYPIVEGISAQLRSFHLKPIADSALFELLASDFCGVSPDPIEKKVAKEMEAMMNLAAESGPVSARTRRSSHLPLSTNQSRIASVPSNTAGVQAAQSAAAAMDLQLVPIATTPSLLPLASTARASLTSPTVSHSGTYHRVPATAGLSTVTEVSSSSAEHSQPPSATIATTATTTTQHRRSSTIAGVISSVVPASTVSNEHQHHQHQHQHQHQQNEQSVQAAQTDVESASVVDEVVQSGSALASNVIKTRSSSKDRNRSTSGGDAAAGSLRNVSNSTVVRHSSISSSKPATRLASNVPMSHSHSHTGAALTLSDLVIPTTRIYVDTGSGLQYAQAALSVGGQGPDSWTFPNAAKDSNAMDMDVDVDATNDGETEEVDAVMLSAKRTLDEELPRMISQYEKVLDSIDSLRHILAVLDVPEDQLATMLERFVIERRLAKQRKVDAAVPEHEPMDLDDPPMPAAQDNITSMTNDVDVTVNTVAE